MKRLRITQTRSENESKILAASWQREDNTNKQFCNGNLINILRKIQPLMMFIWSFNYTARHWFKIKIRQWFFGGVTCVGKMVHLLRPIRPLIFVVNVFLVILLLNVISNNCTVSCTVTVKFHEKFSAVSSFHYWIDLVATRHYYWPTFHSSRE